MPFQNYFDDAYRSGQKVGQDGFVDNKGIMGSLLNLVVDEKALNAEAQGAAVRRELGGVPMSDVKNVNSNSSIYAAQDGLYQYNKDKKEEDYQRNKTDNTEAIELGQRPQMKSFELQADAQRQSNQLLQQQLLQADKHRMLDSADARDAKAQELQYMMMRDRKEDRRYNESIDRQDRKDRQASIQTLVAGLANLGAAFAI